MMKLLSEQASYLHDAEVSSIGLTIDGVGNRRLEMDVHCHPDCGFDDWNDKKLQIEFLEPLVILGELFGHMANAEEINAFDFMATVRMSSSINNLTNAGITPPEHVLTIIFQSGSQLEIACKDVHVTRLGI